MANKVESSQSTEQRLIDQQSALRQVAILVAQGAPPEAVFAAVAEAVGRVIPTADFAVVSRYDGDGNGEVVGTWSRSGTSPQIGLRFPLGGRNLHTLIFETRQPTHLAYLPDDDASPATMLARELGARSSAGAPIEVAGQLWGVIAVASSHTSVLVGGIEHELAAFTELVGTAIANAHSREELRAVAEEQAALRRVATLVAEGAPPEDVFSAVAAEVGQLLPCATFASVGRYASDRTVTFAGTWSRGGESVAPATLRLGGQNASTLVYEQRQPVRIDCYSDSSDIAEAVRAGGMRSAVGAPITVAGRLWGVIVVNAREENAFPEGAEQRLAEFTGVVAAALASAEARNELREVADEQAALRRVATLAAGGAPPPQVFAAVAEEVQRLVPSEYVYIGRYNDDHTVTYVGAWDGGRAVSDEATFPLGGRNLTTMVYEGGQPARLDTYEDASGLQITDAHARGITTGVGVPITVGGRLWGVIVASVTAGKEVHPDTERRLAEFTELLATAISNAEAVNELRRVAGEQAALRRVATHVAEGAPPPQVFSVVAEEVARVLPAEIAVIGRYDEGKVTYLGGWSATVPIEIGTTHPLGGRNVATFIHETGQAAHFESYAEASGAGAAEAREVGISATVGVPITVAGRLWGLMVAAATGGNPIPPGTEARLASFTELLGTAIANAEAQAELAASRARMVVAGDETRRRIERDLHDGAQQRFVAAALTVRAAQAAVPPDLPELAAELDHAAADLTRAIDDLREFARGIHPAVLVEGGLEPALGMLARRSSVPAKLDVRVGRRLPAPIEVAAYYVVSEALTNAAKYAEASVVEVDVGVADDVLHLGVRDDGVGGAVFAPGSGLVGVKDRIEALGGRILVESPRGAGTSIQVELPLDSNPASFNSEPRY